LEDILKDYINDDYNTMLIKTLSYRLAEALSEYLHRMVRINTWGYRKDENKTIAELHKGDYKGIRPAPGYGCCPDHREKDLIFKLLKVNDIKLTQSFMMEPVSSTCGYYFSNPESEYFSVGRISEEQISSYAMERGETTQEQGKWLAGNIN
ncbi:MAG: methionine synthase, partial [Spirochaetales bacterium]|nr:methionine synthase [Spirochaetales bacterium]